jgi:hypothetical protein
MAQVRPAVRTLEALSCCSEALGTGQPLRLHVGQLPAPAAGSSQRWAGLPIDGVPVPGNVVSLGLVGASLPAEGRALAGLLVDEWVEVVPSRRETTAVAFHYQAPGAEAPQAILLAVPSRADATRWEAADLEAALLETIDLVHGRTADLPDLDAAGAAEAGTPLAALLLARKSLLPAVILPGQAAGGPGATAPHRLFVPPPDFGVPVSEQAPVLTGVSPTSALQGQTVNVVVSGSRLDGGSYGLDPPDGVTLTVLTAGAQSAQLRITVGANAPTGGRAIYCVKPLGGAGQQTFSITPRARLDGHVLRRSDLCGPVTGGSIPLVVNGRCLTDPHAAGARPATPKGRQTSRTRFWRRTGRRNEAVAPEPSGTWVASTSCAS